VFSVIWAGEISRAMRNLWQISLYSCNFQTNSSLLQVESVACSTNLPCTISFSVYHQTRCQPYTLCGVRMKILSEMPSLGIELRASWIRSTAKLGQEAYLGIFTKHLYWSTHYTFTFFYFFTCLLTCGSFNP